MPPHNRDHAFSSFKNKCLFSTPVSTLAQHGLQNEGHAETSDLLVSMLSSCLGYGNSPPNVVVLLYLLLNTIIAGDLMVHSAVSRVSRLKHMILINYDDTDNSVSAGR